MEVIPKHKKLVMVVDDNTDYLTVFSISLEKYGLTVLSATSGAAGIDLVRNHLSDLSVIFLDIHMPNTNGVELAKQIRALGYKRTLIAITAVPTISGETGKNQALASGFNLYFSKGSLKPALVEALMNEHCL